MITGSGMVASALARKAPEHGYSPEVCPSDRLDVTDRGAVQELAREIRPELILHTAALTRVNYCETNPGEAYAINRDGTANVAAAAADVRAELVYFSTDYVFDGKREQPWVESDRPAPLNVYGASKLAGEEAVQGWPGGHVVRTSGVFGPRADGKPERNFFRAIVEKLAGGQDVSVTASQRTAVTYAPHLAEMLFALLGERLPAVVHLASSGANSWYGWAVLAARELGIDESRIRPGGGDEASDAVCRPAMSVLATEHAAAARLVSCHPAEDGIAAYVRILDL